MADKIRAWGAAGSAAAAVLLLYLILGFFAIPLISPADGLYTTNRKPEFVWGGMQGEFVLFLDDSPDFETPLVRKVSGNSYRFDKPLDFGTYYWKVESSGISSAVRKLTIGSSVVLSREKNIVRNEGNTEVLLHRMTGAVVLGIGSSVEIEEEENVTAEQV